MSGLPTDADNAQHVADDAERDALIALVLTKQARIDALQVEIQRLEAEKAKLTTKKH